jgi:pimeloyl-ACP methyl ester carboxylesterase
LTTGRIDSLERFDIAGSTQWALLRGDLRARRVLLIVQQGPGLPVIHEACAIEQRLLLESEVLVAYWDQRGTGRSCRADPSTIDPAQLVVDVRAMVDALCSRLGVDRVDILGFSFGATLATWAASLNPARIGRVVAVGIEVDFAESERYACAYAFACGEVARRGDRRAQRKLLWANVRMLMTSPHYSVGQAVQALRAIEKTQERMLPHLQHVDLRAIVSRIEVPIVFFQGRHDVATPPHLVASYVDALDAPRGKSLVWFESSAHMPHYEEPARFREALLRADPLPAERPSSSEARSKTTTVEAPP